MPIWQYNFFLISPVLWVFHEVAAIYSMCSLDSSHLLEATGAPLPPPPKKKNVKLSSPLQRKRYHTPNQDRNVIARSNPYLLNPDALIGSI